MSRASDRPTAPGRRAGEETRCATCGKSVSKSDSKFECPCCGKLCCPDCVQTERTLVMGSTPSKVCIDCFSLLQSYPLSAAERQPVSSGCNETCTTATQRNFDVANMWDTSFSSLHVNESLEKDTVNTNLLSSASPSLCEHVVRLLKATEQLRGEIGVRIKHSADHELPNSALHDAHGGVFDRDTSDKKHTSSIRREQKKPERTNAELYNQSKDKLVLATTLEKDMGNAVSKDVSSEKIIQSLRERVSRYEAEILRLTQIQRCGGPTLPKKVDDILSRRRLPASIVQDTVLTVVTPKPQGVLGISGRLCDWGFDVMELSSRVPSVLQAVAIGVAREWNLFPSEEEERKWIHLVAAMENNYRRNPYHNAVHAADVLQGVFSLVMAAKPLQQHLTLLERKALAFAAMAHDVRHPGRTNGFLSAIHDPVSFQFSGRGILEQLHTATAFELLGVPELDFTSTMDNASFMQFKNIVTQLIAHTDMMLHHDNMTRWGMRVGGDSFDCQRAECRLEALSLILHAADIGASSRGVMIAKKWLVVLDEFAEQAEDERRRNLPVTPGFTRPQCVEKAQIPFLDMFVIPIFDLLQQFFPSVSEPLRNLQSLRELYAVVSGVKTPFPRSVDYRKSDTKVKELEERLEEFRQREKEMYDCLNAIKTSGEKVGRNSAELKAREDDLNERLRLILNQNKGTEYPVLKKFMQSDRDFSVDSEESESAAGKDCVDPRAVTLNLSDTALVDEKEMLLMRERSIQKREAALEASSRVMNRREIRLANYSEKLVEIAENVHGAKKRLRKLEEREALLLRRELTPSGMTTSSLDPTPLSLAPMEAEKHLAKKYNEVDDLLLLVRALRVECLAMRGNEVRRKELCVMLAEREAAIAETVELSRQRRQQAAQGMSLRSDSTHFDRLENAIFQLTAAVTLLTE